MDTTSHQPSKWEDLEHCHMTHDFWGGFGTYLGQYAKNKTMVNIPLGMKKNTTKGDKSMKVARTATFLLLHPPEKGNDKGIPDLLEFKSCQVNMGNLKTMVINKFREKEPPIVFHKEHWSKILGKILGMKTIY